MSRCRTPDECQSPQSCGASGRCWRDSPKPQLKFIHCHRGAMGGSGSGLEMIKQGPLKNCFHLLNSRSIFKAGRGYVLEFCLVIRVRL